MPFAGGVNETTRLPEHRRPGRYRSALRNLNSFLVYGKFDCMVKGSAGGQATAKCGQIESGSK